MIDSKSARVLIVIGFFLFAFISLCYIQKNNALASILIALCYIWEVVITAIVLSDRNISRAEKITLISLILFSFFNVVLNTWGQVVNNVFDYSKKIIMFSGSLVWILFCKHTKINNKTYHALFVFIVVVALSAIYYFRSGFAYEEFGFFLKYGFTNTNQAGLFFATCSVFLLSGIFVYKNKYLRLVICALVAFMLYLTYWTGCRSAMLSVGFVLIMILLDYLFKKTIIGKKTLLFFSVFPILFVYLYLGYISSVTVEFDFGFTDAGKGNNTRMIVWQEALRRAHENLILGDYYGATKGTGESQALNTHLDILESYGIIPLILFIYFLYKTMTYRRLNDLPLENRFGIYAFMSCFITGLFEASLFAGSTGLYIAAFGLLLLSNKTPQ